MEWTLNGEPLFVDGDRVSLKAQGQILAIKKVQMDDFGVYACELWAGNDQLARQVATVTIVGQDGVKIEPKSRRKYNFQPSAVLLTLVLSITLLFATVACCVGFGRIWSSRKVRDRPEPV
ncbi:unnamed protein product [Cylicostephanus goldi]|uniref:Ig-like domain-containing protein n=1 Tax=Cylicostephanus goldi TaxID=71465 RepID=A0A3P6RPI1_CYLGO|nr:unnamed protein product [Cylicostephanus goldi]